MLNSNDSSRSLELSVIKKKTIYKLIIEIIKKKKNRKFPIKNQILLKVIILVGKLKAKKKKKIYNFIKFIKFIVIFRYFN